METKLPIKINSKIPNGSYSIGHVDTKREYRDVNWIIFIHDNHIKALDGWSHEPTVEFMNNFFTTRVLSNGELYSQGYIKRCQEVIYAMKNRFVPAVIESLLKHTSYNPFESPIKMGDPDSYLELD